jgi:hypothetical protein
MDLPLEPEDESIEPTPAPCRPSLAEDIEALRPPLEGRQPPGATRPELPKPTKRRHRSERRNHHVDLTVWPSRLLTGACVVLLVVGVVMWRQADGAGDQGTTAVVAGESAIRVPAPAPTATTTTTVAVADPAVTTTTAPADPAPAVAPEPSTTTTTAPPRPATTTSTTTTTKPPAAPRPISATSASAVLPGVQLTLKAVPPPSGAIRTAQLSVEAEFGDARVLRSARFELGDGTVVDGSVRSWGCGDPAAPNPYDLSGPTSTYAAPGTYTVTVTVRTAPCAIDTGTEGPEETAQVRLVLTVP